MSLLPLSDTGAVVTTWGLKYDLLGVRLEYGATRGVSNELAWPGAEVSVAEGMLSWAFTNTGDHHSHTPAVSALPRIPRVGGESIAWASESTSLPPPLSYKVSCISKLTA